jgi:hypothetical protein
MIGPQFARLLAPVPERMIRTVDKGRKGKFSYLGTTDVKQLLIYLLGRPYEWSVESVFQTGDYDADGKPGDEAWVCVGHLTVIIDTDPIRVGGVGSGTSPKAAESDAFKRAAGKVGVGLGLYGGYWLDAQLVKDARAGHRSADTRPNIEVAQPTDDDDET